MLPAGFLLIAAALRLTSGASYAWAVIKKGAKPNPITWFFWALAPIIVFFAQLAEGVGAELIITFALGFGPFVIFILSLFYSRDHSHFTPSTIICGILAAIGIILWLTTNDPMLAIVFSILADICGSIPTIIKIWHKPHSEYIPAYGITMISMAITALTITDWRFASFAFPAYIFLINSVILATGLAGLHFKPTPDHNKVKRLTSEPR